MRQMDAAIFALDLMPEAFTIEQLFAVADVIKGEHIDRCSRVDIQKSLDRYGFMRMLSRHGSGRAGLWIVTADQESPTLPPQPPRWPKKPRGGRKRGVIA